MDCFQRVLSEIALIFFKEMLFFLLSQLGFIACKCSMASKILCFPFLHITKRATAGFLTKIDCFQRVLVKKALIYKEMEYFLLSQLPITPTTLCSPFLNITMKSISWSLD